MRPGSSSDPMMTGPPTPFHFVLAMTNNSRRVVYQRGAPSQKGSNVFVSLDLDRFLLNELRVNWRALGSTHLRAPSTS